MVVGWVDAVSGNVGGGLKVWFHFDWPLRVGVQQLGERIVGGLLLVAPRVDVRNEGLPLHAAKRPPTGAGHLRTEMDGAGAGAGNAA